MTVVQAKRRNSYLPWDLMILGGAMAAILGYILQNTTMLLAYRGGTLGTVHAYCQNAFVLALSHGKCTEVNSYYTLSSVLLWGGVVVAIAGAIIRIVKHQGGNNGS